MEVEGSEEGKLNKKMVRHGEEEGIGGGGDQAKGSGYSLSHSDVSGKCVA